MQTKEVKKTAVGTSASLPRLLIQFFKKLKNRKRFFLIKFRKKNAEKYKKKSGLNRAHLNREDVIK